jgi:hypothetical protein
MTTASDGAAAAGYLQLRMALRCPRVAIVVPRDEFWQTHVAMAMWAASRTWGGSGFIIVPSESPKVLLRAVGAYDPDYVAGLSYTFGELWGWGVRPRPNDPETGKQYEADSAELKIMTGETAFVAGSDTVAAACSPFLLGRGDVANRDVTSIGSDQSATGLRPALDSPAGTEDDPIGRDVTGDLGLLLAMRSGFLRRPKLPFDAENGADQADLREWLPFVLRGQPTPRAQGRRVDGPVREDGWSLTEDGVGWVGRLRVMTKHLVVVGDTVDDFALALAWDRMNGHSTATWVPTSVLSTSAGVALVGRFLDSVAWDLRREGGHIVAASCSFTVDQMRQALSGAVSRAPRMVVPMEGQELEVEYVAPDELVFDSPQCLAYTPGEDYDIRLTLPVNNAASGSVDLVSPLPAIVPTALRDAGVRRPDWVVDVDLRPRAMPRGRGLRSDAMLANSDQWTPVRSARDGLSFKAQEMGFVTAAASLRQSIAQPILRFPGLLEWAQRIAAPDYEVAYSDAGRTAQICAQIWGGRGRMLRELPAVRPLLAEFARQTHRDATDFPEHDGRAVSGLGPVLTFAGCRRALGAGAESSRQQIDGLLDAGILRRGLVLRCATCSGRAFVAIDDLAQRNPCARCGTTSSLVQARWDSAESEPAWYYSLHGAFRDLMRTNGDIPLLGAAYLAKQATHYADEAELDFLSGGDRTRRTEVDLLAAADGELAVGEAKINLHNARGPRALDKLVYVAARLMADRIVLFSGANEPWNQPQLDRLNELRETVFRPDGIVPRLTSIVGLTTSEPTVNEH